MSQQIQNDSKLKKQSKLTPLTTASLQILDKKNDSACSAYALPLCSMFNWKKKYRLIWNPWPVQESFHREGCVPTFSVALCQAHCKSPKPQDAFCLTKLRHLIATVFCHPM